MPEHIVDPPLGSLKCPRCGELIPISEAIHHQLAERAERDAHAKMVERERELVEKERSLAEQTQTQDRIIQEQVSAARAAAEAEAERKATQFFALELEDLRRQAAEKDERLRAAQQAELVLRKQQRDVEERQRTLELEAARRIDQERLKIQQETMKWVEDRHRLQEAEREKKLQDALAVNEELRRKLQQGSQQTQGEVLELELEELIRANFPRDEVEPVPKGVNGADIVHRVRNNNGQCCGTIVWESKRTKSWSEAWIPKLKDDLRLVKGDLAVIVSQALPKDVRHFAQLKGIWITSRECAIGLGSALRAQLLEIARVRAAAAGKSDKMEVLYRYISGPEFKQRVEAVMEAFIEMQHDLNEERRIAERRWSRREKQIQRVICHTSGMYGDLQGLLGPSLREIPALRPADHLDAEGDLRSADEYSPPLQGNVR